MGNCRLCDGGGRVVATCPSDDVLGWCAGRLPTIVAAPGRRMLHLLLLRPPLLPTTPVLHS